MARGLGGPHRYSLPGGAQGAKRYADIALSDTPRLTAGIDEFDRVLGGGIVPGSLVLLGGEPGIGKSTLLLQAAANFAHAPRAGAVRLGRGIGAPDQGPRRAAGRRRRAAVPAGRDLRRAHPRGDRPGAVRGCWSVDSIQTVFSLKFQSAPGSIGQVREAATQFLFTAKGHDLPTFLVGHVTKDGSLAGPKVLEHVVDTVLYFEGERHHSHRVVRAIKNRFGAVSELGVFEMTGAGLRPVPNPSQLFLAERPTATPGSAVLCCVEGSRPLLVEVQALVSTATYGTARRMAVGIDTGRVALLLAVLEKRAGLVLVGEDVFVNIAGGMTVDEPAADLAVLAALASSVRNRPIPPRHGGVRRGRASAGKCAACRRRALRLREARQLGLHARDPAGGQRRRRQPARRRRRRHGARRRAPCRRGARHAARREPNGPSFHLLPHGVLADSGDRRLHDRPRHAVARLDAARRPRPLRALVRPRLVVADPGRPPAVRVEVRGLDRLTPGATYVFVANHQSIYDIPVLFGSLPFQLRIIAKAVARPLPVPRLAPAPHRPHAGRSQAARSGRHLRLGAARCPSAGCR